MIEVDSVYGEIDRLRFGFATPNQAAAALACVFPGIWFIGVTLRIYFFENARNSKKVLYGAVLVLAIIEFTVWMALARTGSRGGMLATGIGCLFFSASLLCVYYRKKNCILLQKLWLWIIVRLILASTAVYISGLASRLKPDFASHDLSVLNRLVLWRGGVELIAAAPLRGWGSGESGYAFENWTQPLEKHERYSTMVNSFLTIAVEFGLGVALSALVVVLFLIMLPIAVSLERLDSYTKLRQIDQKSAFRENSIEKKTLLDLSSVYVSSTWASWACVNTFSTLWTDPRLWLLPGFAFVSAVAIVVFTNKKSHFLLVGYGSVCGSLLLAGLTWILGVFLAQSHSWRMALVSRGTIALEGRRAAPEKSATSVALWPDNMILGETSGKEIRRLMESEYAPAKITIFEPRLVSFSNMTSARKTLVIFTGDEVWRLKDAASDTSIVLNPRGCPPDAIYSNVTLVLPEFDQEGNSYQWKGWGERCNAAILVSKDVGLDIRAAWPKIIGQAIAVARKDTKNNRD